MDVRRTGAWKTLRLKVLKEENYVCYLCHKQTDDTLPRDHPDKSTVDHLVAVEVDPSLGLVRENLRCACRSCNGKKNNKELTEYLDQQAPPRAPLKTSRDWTVPPAP